MSSTVVPFKNQHYSDLKRDCIKNKKLFEDPEFPANDSSVFYEEQPHDIVEWKRPGVSASKKRWHKAG
uniref:Calpain catalytic domain-containing protein n=1 Tax=Oryzias melastigma TaxID=30732 RepID=A0A3B3B7Q9_ORYME